MAKRFVSDHILGVRKANGPGWVTGVVHARVRHGKAALELRGTSYALTLQGALESLATPERLNGHGGVASELLGATAGLDARELILRAFLNDPGGTLLRLSIYDDGVEVRYKLTRKDWARRSGVNVSTIRRILHGSQQPSLATARRLLEALQ